MASIRVTTNEAEALASRRRALEAERLELDEEELRLKRIRLENEKKIVSDASSNIIELNVGGQIFATSRETLLQKGSPYFERLLESGETGGAVIRGAQRDSAGRIFIDRSPDIFRHILEYMRGCSQQQLLDTIRDDKEKKSLLEEALFYQIDDLVEKLTLHGGGYDPSYLSDQDQKIRSQAVGIRKAFEEGQLDAPGNASASLIDLFDPATGNLTLAANYQTEISPTSNQATLVFQKHALHARKTSPHDLPKNITDFKRRLVEYAGPLFKNFPFEKVVVAGGAVLSALLGHTGSYREGDVDLFLVADNSEEARSIYDKIIAHFAQPRLETEISHHELLVLRSPFAVTLQVGFPQRNVQIILAHHTCPAEVIFHFDVDCCQVLYDGKNVRTTPSGHRALVTGINFADPERRSVNYESRLAKYADRGFLVAIPGLELSRVNKKYMQDHFYSIMAGQLRHVTIRFQHKEKTTTQMGLFEREVPDHRVAVDAAIEDGEVVGLSKLLVFANCFHCTEYFNERCVTGEDTFPYIQSNRKGRGYTFLINAQRILDTGGLPWSKPTPPFPPPSGLIQKLEETRTSSDNNRIVFYDANLNVPSIICEEVFERLDELTGERHRSSSREPLCVYSLLRDVRTSTRCPEIEDASRMYRRYNFPDEKESRGKLQRFLRIPASTTKGNNPWIRLDEAGWTNGTYS